MSKYISTANLLNTKASTTKNKLNATRIIVAPLCPNSCLHTMWCKWLRSALKGDMPWNKRIKTTRDKSKIKINNAPIINEGVSDATIALPALWIENNFMLQTEIKNPITSEPVSPIKIFAGSKLKYRNAVSAPITQ